MVTAEKRTSRPVVGWVQVLSARSRMAVLSAPRAGGELKSAPMTEKRNRAHKGPVELRGVWDITSPLQSGEGTVTSVLHRPTRVGEGHLLRVERAHHETVIRRPPGIVTGARKRSSCTQPAEGIRRRRKASTSE